MTDDKKKPVDLKVGENSFELILRILGNEFIAIRIGSTRTNWHMTWPPLPLVMLRSSLKVK